MAGEWLHIAQSNFSDNRFSNWLVATKAFNLFQNSTADFDDGFYRTQAAILNGLLMHYSDTSDGKFYDTRWIGHLLDQFDKLIARSICLPKSNSLERLQCLVKSTFYIRIADFILYASLSQSNASGLRLSVLAMFSYQLALEWAYIGCGLPEADPLIFLCVAELSTLVKANLKKNPDLEFKIQGCNGQLLYSFVRCYAMKVSNNSFADASPLSFLLSDQTDIDPISTKSFDLPHLIVKAWPLQRNVHFLRRLVWILANEQTFHRNNYRIFDEQLNFLPQCIRKNSLVECSPETITCTDVKLFILRLSVYLKPCKTSVDEFVLPWIFYNKPTPQHQKFWDAIHLLASHQGRMDALGLSDMLTIANSLEQIRCPEASLSDVPNLVNTMEALERMVRSAAPDPKEFYQEMMERYADAAKVALSEQSSKMDTFPSDGIKSLFPPSISETTSSSDNASLQHAKKSIEQFFAKKLEATQDTTGLQNEASNEGKQDLLGRRMEEKETALHSVISSSTQTDVVEEKVCGRKTEETNWKPDDNPNHHLLERLIYHNRTLIKLFL